MSNHLQSSSPQLLAELNAGDHAVFLYARGGKGITSRMTSLGFTPGVEIEMIQNYGHGPLLVLVRGTRVALGRQEARNTYIQRS